MHKQAVYFITLFAREAIGLLFSAGFFIQQTTITIITIILNKTKHTHTHTHTHKKKKNKEAKQNNK